MLLLFGDQLIRDPGIAVFELVKNAYDADATNVTVTLSDVANPSKGMVVVEDNGCGMDWDIITNVWLEPGTDYREQQKRDGERTPKFGRLPLGEKGVGRFAAHKLGRRIRLITRKAGSAEVVVEIDWKKFSGQDYLDATDVEISEREPEHFGGRRTGTRIEVRELQEGMSRGTVRQIHRAVTSICSPFGGPNEFAATIEVSPDESLLDGLLDVRKVLEAAPYVAICEVNGDQLEYDYEFTPFLGMERIGGRKAKGVTMKIPDLVDLANSAAIFQRIGDVYMEFRIFDLDPQVLAFASNDRKGLKDFLRYNGGVRVYRDGIRVYDYGEPGNDWLELGVRRVNHPTRHVTSNQIIGAVHIRGESSRGLIEKTNREGFIEDENYRLFKEIVSFSLAQVELERNKDKQRIRAAYSSRKLKEPVIDETEKLKEELRRHPEVEIVLLPLVEDVEYQYRRMRDDLLTAASAGLTLTTVIHEVEKAIKNVSTAIERNAPIDELKENAVHLNELIEGLTYLTRKTGRLDVQASSIIRKAIYNTNYRLRAHSIDLINGIEDGNPDFFVKCTQRLIIASLMNLFDNSIFWLRTKGKHERKIYIGTSTNLPGGGPAIFVADNGPGFQDPPEMMIEPFMTRKPEGTGLGLHIVDQIMKAHEGRLAFPSREDLGLQDDYVGAIVALQFKGEK
jgi:signal transduction histidine kinase